MQRCLRKGSDFSALSSFRRWYFPKTFATDMNSKFFPRFLLLFSLIAFCLPAPKFLLLETENNGEDAGGGEAAEQTRDETGPQVDFDFSLNFASFSCHSVDFVHKPTSFSLSVMRGNPLPTKSIQKDRCFGSKNHCLSVLRGNLEKSFLGQGQVWWGFLSL